MWTKTYRVSGFLEPGVVKFGDKNLMIYISQKTIDRYSHRLKGKPITVGHIAGITENNAQQHSVGDVAVCDKPGDCIVTIKDEEADKRISNGERFSCCWIPIKWGPGGTWHNIPYDKELLEMDFTHLAIVPDPRYENVEVFMNSKDKEFDNATFKPRSDDAGPGFDRASADSQTKVARAAQKTTFDAKTFTERPRQPKGTGGRKIVKISSFQNSLSDKQLSFLRKIALKNKEYNNYDDSSERMSRVKSYLEKRESRKLDEQYKLHEEPKKSTERVNTHFDGYKNSKGMRFKRRDGKEFNNNVFKEALKRWDGNGRGEKRIDNTRSLLTERTGRMPKISQGSKGASARITEAKAKRLAEDL